MHKLTMDEDVYLLEMPNNEVKKAFNLHVVAAFTEKGQIHAKQIQLDMNEALRKNDLQKALEILRGIYAGVPYQLHVDLEAYYHSIFYSVMSALGFDVSAEVSVSGGRIDAVLELEEAIFVIEFKYWKCLADATPEDKQKLFEKALDEGMRQIKDKGYANKYSGSGKKIYLIAFAFLGRADIEMIVEYLAE